MLALVSAKCLGVAHFFLDTLYIVLSMKRTSFSLADVYPFAFMLARTRFLC